MSKAKNFLPLIITYLLFSKAAYGVSKNDDVQDILRFAERWSHEQENNDSEKPHPEARENINPKNNNRKKYPSYPSEEFKNKNSLKRTVKINQAKKNTQKDYKIIKQDVCVSSIKKPFTIFHEIQNTGTPTLELLKEVKAYNFQKEINDLRNQVVNMKNIQLNLQAYEKKNILLTNELERNKQQLDEIKKANFATENELSERQTALKLLKKNNDDLLSKVKNLNEYQKNHSSKSSVINSMRETDFKWFDDVSQEYLQHMDDNQASFYALGIIAGRDINDLIKHKESVGVKADKHLMLTGIRDSMFHRQKVSEKILENILQRESKEEKRVVNSLILNAKTNGNNALKVISEDPNSHQDSSGFWWVIRQKGEKVIPVGSVPRVVVKESLLDGSVIQDMFSSHQFLQQAVDAYPPAFRKVLKNMNVGGEAELIVPPELAYGHEGLPPSIPPDATMVYKIKITGFNEIINQDSK